MNLQLRTFLFLALFLCALSPLIAQDDGGAVEHFARQGFDFSPPPGWGHREVGPDEVEFVGPSNGVFSPRIQVKRHIRALFVGEKQEELHRDFVDDVRRRAKKVPEILSEEIVSENGRDVLHIEGRVRLRGADCRIIRRYTSSEDRAYEINFFDSETSFAVMGEAVRAALSSFDTEGAPVSDWTLLYEIALFLVLAAAGFYYWLDKQRERRVMDMVEEPEINLRSADGEYILPIEDIESPGRVANRRGSHGGGRDGGMNEYDISFFGGSDDENKTL